MTQGTVFNMNEPLGEKELKMKRVYEHSDKNLWLHPMTYEQYLTYCGGQELMEDEAWKMRLGHLMEQPEKAANDRNGSEENEVVLFPCGKYSYPVMYHHGYIEIIYVCFGQCVHFVESSSMKMQQGDLCILSPNTQHAVSVTNDRTFVLSILISEKVFNRNFTDLLRGDYILVDFFEKIIRNESVSNYILFQTGQDLWMQRTAHSMCEEFHKKSYAYEKVIALYVELMLVHLVRNYEMMAIVSNEESMTQNKHIVAVLGYLSVNYHSATLNQTADFFGYTPAYFSKLIKKYTGQNFTMLITDLQMTNAKRYLDEGETNITEIAHRVGCFDTSHFNRKFKAKYQMTPTEYKKKIHSIA